MKPDVSVVIAAKNEAKHVREAVVSVATQSGVAHELIFVDDGSVDRTFEVVQSLSKQFTNITLVRSPSQGKVSAFNHGVELARGRWVCLFAGDDIMPEGSLARRYEAVRHVREDEPVVGLCRLVTMSQHKRIDGHVIPKSKSRGGLTGVSYLMNIAAQRLMFPVPTTLPNEDTWLETAVLHLDIRLIHSGVIGCKWRVHEGNSINMLGSYVDFNRKLTPRMEAYRLFLSVYGDQLSATSRTRLEAKVRCEDARRTGSILGIMSSGAPMVECLRALSLSNRAAYFVRSKLYGLFSGW